MIVLGPDEIASASEGSVESLLARREMAVAIADGRVRGYATAMLLHSDVSAVTDRCIVTIDSSAAWSGALWRMGQLAARLHFHGRATLRGDEAFEAGLCDELVPAGTDPLNWVAGWIDGRSTVALQSAAALIRLRGGDRLERAEFTRLFAAGEPQKGLAAFLAKRRPEWKGTL